MPINTHEIMALLGQLADQRNLRVAVTESMKCGLVVGLSAAIGGILVGPLGLAVGGTLASIVAAFKSHGKFKSVAQVIAEDMTHTQQLQLAASCSRILQDFRVEDIAILLPLILNSPSAQQALIGQVVSYITKEMELKIID